ncbi:MAG: hypothetical protein NDI61_07855 [Bdellovibrionaceae bacterium]|nr:hypothetical protein [Pseudobdellovibrionaceae bacterium]
MRKEQMKQPLVFIAAITFAFFEVVRPSAVADTSLRAEQVRKIIRESQHEGAHGPGYDAESLKEMSAQLSPSDSRVLLDLYQRSSEPEHKDLGLRTGVVFALASLCQTGIETVLLAVQQNIMDEIDAINGMNLIAKTDHCDSKTKQNAVVHRQKIEKISTERRTRAQKQRQEDEKNDARIQENGLKMLHPEESRSLSRQEREEVFKRSIKAIGLDGPRTPDQEKMYRQMYEAMVLGKKQTSSGQ